MTNEAVAIEYADEHVSVRAIIVGRSSAVIIGRRAQPGAGFQREARALSDGQWHVDMSNREDQERDLWTFPTLDAAMRRVAFRAAVSLLH